MSRRKSPWETNELETARREHVVQLGEERERRGEPEPAVEVVSVVSEAKAEPDQRDRLRRAWSGEHDDEQHRLVVAGESCGIPTRERARKQPDRDLEHDEREERPPQGPPARRGSCRA